ncbi:MAG: hypothetical protein ACYC40_00145 [Patescibacteria group bacterium]
MTKNKKRLLIIISLAVLLLIIGWLIFLLFNRQAGLTTNKTNQNEQVDKSLSKIELQKDLDNFQKAQENNNLDSCSLISNGLSRDFCVQEIAVRTKASSSCLLIGVQETQSNCLSITRLNSATANKDLIECQKIEQPMLVKTCIERIAESDKNTDCNLITNSELKNNCLSVIYYQKAKSSKDAKVCRQIPELIRRANCLSELENIDLHSDADKDGLDFLQEIVNNTDPNNPDTDGDGYKDGDEFKNGFNPDGQGTLALAQSPSSIDCQDIKDETIKAACFLEFKNHLLDFSKCSEIKDAKLKDYCGNIFTPAKVIK